MGVREDKRDHILSRLPEFDFDVEKLAAAVDVSASTIYRWIDDDAANYASLDAAFDEMEKSIRKQAVQLSRSLMVADDGTFSQRVTALGTLITAMMKLRKDERERLEQDRLRDEPIRVVFVDCDGSEHDTPSWERVGDDDAVQS
jgi:hypothetical protein